MSAPTMFATNAEKIARRNQRTEQLLIPTQKSGMLLCTVCKSEKKFKFLSFVFTAKNEIKLSVKVVCTSTQCKKSRGRSYTEEYDILPTKEADELRSIMARSESQYQTVNKYHDMYTELTQIKGIGDKLVDAIIAAGYSTPDELVNATTEEIQQVQGITKAKAEAIKKKFP